MQNANLHDATLDLSRLVDAAIAGEDVVISQDGKPSVRLVPLEPIHQVWPPQGADMDRRRL